MCIRDRPDDIREYGFLPEGIYDRDTFALRLMEKPASFFYSCLLYTSSG